MKKTIINLATNQTTVQDLTPEEIAQDNAKILAEAEAEAEKQAKLESARTKLAALGLDEDEIAAIVGN